MRPRLRKGLTPWMAADSNLLRTLLRPAMRAAGIGFLITAAACDHDVDILARHEIDSGFATGIASSSLYLEMDLSLIHI